MKAYKYYSSCLLTNFYNWCKPKETYIPSSLFTIKKNKQTKNTCKWQLVLFRERRPIFSIFNGRVERSYSVINNDIIYFCFILCRKLRMLGNIFIVNLAIADFCVSSLINAFTIVALVTNGAFFEPRHGLCEFIAVMCVTTCVCSVWSIASISVNRYTKICHHFIYHKVYNQRTVGFIVGGVWFCSFLVDLPNIIGGWGNHGFDSKLMMCTYDHRGSDYGSTIFFVAVGYGLPWIVTVYAYLYIFSFVRDKRKAVERSQQGGKKELNKMGISNTDLSLLRSTFTIFVLFFVMWAPYTLIVLCDAAHAWPNEVYVVAGFFAHTNSSINSIMYAVTNKNFREGYMRILRCNWKTSRVTPDVSVTHPSNNKHRR